MTNDFQRYLRAKRTVDDRSLDRQLLDSLRTALADRPPEPEDPLQVLEIGAGIGTMLSRLLEWDVLPPGAIQYTAVDIDADVIAALPTYLREWASERPYSLTGTEPLVLDGPERTIEVAPIQADAVTYAEGATTAYDLLIGAALLDIVDRDALTTLLNPVAPGGHAYFPITFDGATRFRPRHQADQAVERRYHAHMDDKPGGSSQAGGDVLARFQTTDGVTALQVAGSDWIVRPTADGYPADEAYFLRYILETIDGAVREMGGVSELDEWLQTRRDQVAAGTLVYHTHQLDFLFTVGEPLATDG